jgi:hypothetical protein
VGFVVDETALGQVFFGWFPLPNIPPTAPRSSSSMIICVLYNRPVVASVIVGSVSLHPKKGKEGNFCLGYFFDRWGGLYVQIT